MQAHRCNANIRAGRERNRAVRAAADRHTDVAGDAALGDRLGRLALRSTPECVWPIRHQIAGTANRADNALRHASLDALAEHSDDAGLGHLGLASHILLFRLALNQLVKEADLLLLQIRLLRGEDARRKFLFQFVARVDRLGPVDELRHIAELFNHPANRQQIRGVNAAGHVGERTTKVHELPVLGGSLTKSLLAPPVLIQRLGQWVSAVRLREERELAHVQFPEIAAYASSISAGSTPYFPRCSGPFACISLYRRSIILNAVARSFWSLLRRREKYGF